MYNLNNSDLVLKALQVKDLTNLVSDLNYNFLQILNSPGFKGRPGIGIKGDDGESVRGSRWFFVDSSKFILSYPDDVSDPSSLTLQRINSLFKNSDETLFNTTLGLTDGDSIVLGDTIVLPDGQVCQVIEDNNTVIIGDSGITFKNATSLTEDRVIELISQLSGSGSSSNQSGTFSIYSGVAKNYPDSSGSVNNSSNNDSAIDINSTGSGPGTPLNNKYVAAKELSVTSNTLMCLIAGSVAKYHELIQKTQEVDTNESTPQVKDFPAFIALQNNYQSGLLFGHKDSASMKSFGRIYRSETSLNIASRSTNNNSEYTEANFKNTEILLRASNKISFNAQTLDFSNTSVLLSPYLNYASSILDLGNDSSSTKIYLKANSGVFLNNQTANRLISIDANKKIISPYSVVSSYDSSSTHSQLLSALSIKNKFDSLDANIVQDRLRLDALELSAGEDHFIKRSVQTGLMNLNGLSDTGTYTIDINAIVFNWPFNFVSLSSLQDNEDFQTCTLNVFSSINEVGASLHQELIVSMSTSENTIVLKRSAVRTVSNQWSFNGWVNISEKYSIAGVLGNPAVIDSIKEGNTEKYTISHETKSATTENRLAPDGVGIYDVELDAFGHPTKFKKQDFDNRYPTKTAYNENNTTINQRITDLDDRYYTQTQLDTTINALIDRLVELEKTNAVFNSGNGSVWWRGTVESIPDGWIVDTSMAGLVPVGQKDGDADFGFLNTFGGYKTHQLTVREMPIHNHQWKFTKGVKFKAESNQDGTGYVDQNQGIHGSQNRDVDRYPLNSSGSNIPHNNLQPYRVGVWIKRETV